MRGHFSFDYNARLQKFDMRGHAREADRERPSALFPQQIG